MEDTRYRLLLEQQPNNEARRHLYQQQRLHDKTPGYRAGHPLGLQFRSLNDARLAKRGDYEAYVARARAQVKAFMASLDGGARPIVDCEDPAVQSDPVYQKVRTIVQNAMVQYDPADLPEDWRFDRTLDERIISSFVQMHGRMLNRQMGEQEYKWFQHAEKRDILQELSKPARTYTAPKLSA